MHVFVLDQFWASLRLQSLSHRKKKQIMVPHFTERQKFFSVVVGLFNFLLPSSAVRGKSTSFWSNRRPGSSPVPTVLHLLYSFLFFIKTAILKLKTCYSIAEKKAWAWNGVELMTENLESLRYSHILVVTFPDHVC